MLDHGPDHLVVGDNLRPIQRLSLPNLGQVARSCVVHQLKVLNPRVNYRMYPWMRGDRWVNHANR